MALSDPLELLVVMFVVLAIPVMVVYWIVRLAVRRELERRPGAELSHSGE